MKETIEEAAEKYAKQFYYAEDSSAENDFIEGAKSDASRDYWFEKFQEQDKNMFSEEDMKAAWENGMKSAIVLNASFEMWLEQFKNK
jgi:hypothetical protein